MPYIFRRGQSIPFAQTYYDSTGGTVEPSSVRCWITYAPVSTTFGSYPAETCRHTTNFSLIYNTSSNAFEGTWASSMAGAGAVYYHIKASDTTLDVVDGKFDLRGNPANRYST